MIVGSTNHQVQVCLPGAASKALTPPGPELGMSLLNNADLYLDASLSCSSGPLGRTLCCTGTL